MNTDREMVVSKRSDNIIIAALIICLLALLGVLGYVIVFGVRSAESVPDQGEFASDGTLTGVPSGIQSCTVTDGYTGVQYLLLHDADGGDIALYPRYNADGSLYRVIVRDTSSDESESDNGEGGY